jgi:hypothetical protein
MIEVYSQNQHHLIQVNPCKHPQQDVVGLPEGDIWWACADCNILVRELDRYELATAQALTE